MNQLRFLVKLALVVSLPLLEHTEGKTKYLKTFAGPYYIYGTKVYGCADSVAPHDWYNISVKFLNLPRSHLETQSIAVDIHLLDQVKDTDSVVVRIDSWLNNQWKENSVAKIPLPHACSSFRQFMPNFFEKIFTTTAKAPAPCVIDAGRYYLEKEPMNWTFPQVPYFYYGDYRVQALMNRDRQPKLCFMGEAKIVPRPV